MENMTSIIMDIVTSDERLNNLYNTDTHFKSAVNLLLTTVFTNTKEQMTIILTTYAEFAVALRNETKTIKDYIDEQNKSNIYI